MNVWDVHLYASTVSIVLSICYCLYISCSLLRDKKSRCKVKRNSLVVSWFLLLVPGFLLDLACLVENMRQIYSKERLHEGLLCKVLGFIAIFTVTSQNGASSTVAYVTYLFVKHGKTPPMNTTIFGNLLSWLMGIAIAFIYLSGNVIGPYRGIYCCVKQENYSGILVAEIFLVFAFSLGLQTFLYWRGLSLSHSSFQLNASRTSRVVMQRGLEMICIFHTSYLLIAADAVAVFTRVQTSIWLSVVASCIVKLQPFCHCFLFHHILKKMNKKNAQVHPTQTLSKNKARTRFSFGLQLLCSRSNIFPKYAQISARREGNLHSHELEDVKSP